MPTDAQASCINNHCIDYKVNGAKPLLESLLNRRGDPKGPKNAQKVTSEIAAMCNRSQ